MWEMARGRDLIKLILSRGYNISWRPVRKRAYATRKGGGSAVIGCLADLASG